MPDNSIDAIVTDPPYGLKFMGKEWDHGVPGVVFWQEALRVCKPGAHLLAFGGTRTHHRLMVAIEDAGWEIRDCLGWLYGSGFPKSLDVSKAIDKEAGANREPILDENGNQVWTSQRQGKKSMFDGGKERPATYPATYWSGWGTALKPAWEPIVLARKPLEGTVAENVQKWGVGAINIDGCRVDAESTPRTGSGKRVGNIGWGTGKEGGNSYNGGRFPANILHDGSEEVMGVFPDLHGSCNQLDRGIGLDKGYDASSYEMSYSGRANRDYHEKSGSAARFFYCAKASRSERGEGNNHPTVKPIALIKYLIKLITPEGGTVMDMFAGSGTTGIAAIELRVHSINIDKEESHTEIIDKRVQKATQQGRLF